jgi:hypothetical protein
MGTFCEWDRANSAVLGLLIDKRGSRTALGTNHFMRRRAITSKLNVSLQYLGCNSLNYRD